MSNELDLHPICYYDMAEDEINRFKHLRETFISDKQADLSKVSQSEVNEEIQRDSKRDHHAPISFKYVYP